MSVRVRWKRLNSIVTGGVSLTVFQGKRKGHASSSDDSRDSLRDTLQAAAAIARYTEEDPHAGLAPADMLARDIPDLDLYHPWQMDTPDCHRGSAAL